MAYGDDKTIELGSPVVTGAKVEADIIKNSKERTILIFKKRRRQNSRRKNGHRQNMSIVQITKIYGKDGKVVSEKSNENKKVKKIEPTKKTRIK